MAEYMTFDNQFLLQDRLQKIQQVIGTYGAENFSLSFSGGKDSTVLSTLIDMALPENNIPRVYVDTGIELGMIRDFVFGMAKEDQRIVVIKPHRSIKKALEEEGYPFKSKEHSKWVYMFQKNGRTQSIENYTASQKKDKDLFRTCPKKLLYQFEDGFDIKVSDKCCLRLKENPIDEWAKENNKPYQIVGIMAIEGGRRMNAQCLAFSGGKLKRFQPLVPMTKEWEEWFIGAYSVKICDIYKPPYNFTRTGCKGCPFALHLQEELDVLKRFFPNERKQCEKIWEPIYSEYRRIGYRLNPIESDEYQMTIDEWVGGSDE